ncbi:MAG: c-type cytochrome [Casimicrobiaceae bacterium]
MCRCSSLGLLRLTLLLLCAIPILSSAAPANAVSVGVPPKYGFGKPATRAEIAGWDIDVRPDGTGLPKGRGSVAQGQAIYDEKCASCHGTFGESNSYMPIAGGVGSLATDQPVRTTGSKLNYATTLWDYINRAMPFQAPQTLRPDEVYALTAYVLHLNDIVPADTVLDQTSLPKLKMPNRDGFTTDHGLMRRDGKPDTQNSPCMTNCASEVRLSSEMPDYARDQHGNLAEQTRPSRAAAALPGAGKPAAVPVKGGAELAKAAACMACHGIEQKIVGPGFREIAAKYRGAAGAELNLAEKVKMGSVGVWGASSMPAQPQVKPADTRTIVQWILAGAK